MVLLSLVLVYQFIFRCIVSDQMIVQLNFFIVSIFDLRYQFRIFVAQVPSLLVEVPWKLIFDIASVSYHDHFSDVHIIVYPVWFCKSILKLMPKDFVKVVSYEM